MTPLLHAIAQNLALRMADSLVWGTVVFLFAAVVSRVTRQSAGTRFAVWFSALMAIGFIPLVGSAWAPGGFLSASAAGRAAITLSDRWALYLSAAWAAIALWFVVGIGRAVWHLHVLRRDSVAIDPDTLDPLLRETLLWHEAGRCVTLCTSETMRVPTALGLLSPTIVLPCWVMKELSAIEVNQILLHELAHLRRFDDWTNLLQQAIKAVFFFHPAVWWIEKRVELEREMACDDAVLAVTASPRAYAECLAHLAEKSFLQRSVALAQAALGTIRHTSLRVAKILSGRRDSGKVRSWKPAVSLVGAFAFACSVWSARAPRLIAFRDGGAVRGSVTATTLPPTELVDSGVTLPAHIVQVTPAKYIPSQASRKPRLKTKSSATPFRPKRNAANMVHLTATETALVPFTETVFFVIEGSDSISPNLRVVQIQMFRVTILHSTAEPASNRIPQKET